jgi:hypothetical protein
MSRYPLFDRSQLRLHPLHERCHDLAATVVMPLSPVPCEEEKLLRVGALLCTARQEKAAGILMMGAHVLRKGCQQYIIDLMQKGFVTCLAVNGACAIHDYELALAGGTTESVARYIRDGRFGLWEETGDLNNIVRDGARNGLGAGEAIGKAIAESSFPFKETSVFAAAWEAGVPVTVHVGIGYDIVAEHPGYDGAAWGQASYTDFLIFAREVSRLEGGVVMNFGSAVMAPEIFLKALAMVRNVCAQNGMAVAKFATLVCDLHTLPEDTHTESPKDAAAYYYRPWKTMLVRTVADGGSGFYVRGDHADTIPQLWSSVMCASRNASRGDIVTAPLGDV